MRILLFIVAGAFLLLAGVGCETAAERMDPALVATIQPGVTTRADVLKQFGNPRETLSAGGRTLFGYERVYKAWLNRYGPITPARVVALSVLFDANDRVLRSHYSSHQLVVQGGLSTVTAGTPISGKKLAQIVPHKTTRGEALALLGEPATESLALDGNLVLNWPDVQADLIGGGASQVRNVRVVQVAFDEDGVVLGVRTVQKR